MVVVVALLPRQVQGAAELPPLLAEAAALLPQKAAAAAEAEAARQYQARAPRPRGAVPPLRQG